MDSKKIKFCTILCTFLLLPSVLLAQIEEDEEIEEQIREGLFLRGLFGVGSSSFTDEAVESSNLTFTTGSIDAHIGYVIYPSLIPHFNLGYTVGGDQEEGRNLAVLNLGLGVSYYFPGDIYVSPEVRYSITSSERSTLWQRPDGMEWESTDTRTFQGIGLGVSVGKEWWTAEGLSIGVALYYKWDSLSGDTRELTIEKKSAPDPTQDVIARQLLELELGETEGSRPISEDKARNSLFGIAISLSYDTLL